MNCSSVHEASFCKIKLCLEFCSHPDRLRLSQPGVVGKLCGQLAVDVLGDRGEFGLVDQDYTVVEH